MYKLTFLIVALFIGFPGAANAQYVDEEAQGPLFGGAGDYAYPLLCLECGIWQDYRNYAWNQLDIHGGYAHTPSIANNVTTFWIYTHATEDLFPTVVEITPEVVDIEVWSSKVGQIPVEPEHLLVHTHPENGDRVRINLYPENMRKLVFPYEPPRSSDSPTSAHPNRPGSGGGGDSSGGTRAGWGRGRIGGTGIGGWSGGNAGGNYCGFGTDYICIQF